MSIVATVSGKAEDKPILDAELEVALPQPGKLGGIFEGERAADVDGDGAPDFAGAGDTTFADDGARILLGTGAGDSAEAGAKELEDGAGDSAGAGGDVGAKLAPKY